MIKIIKEMPWISYADDKIFDLEFENVKEFDDLITFIQNIFRGKKFRDKHNNIIDLNTTDEKLSFLRSLQKDPIYNAYIKNKLSDRERRLLNSIIQRSV